MSNDLVGQEVTRAIHGKEFAHFYNRALIHLRRVMNDGAGPYLLASFTILIAVALVHLALRTTKKYNDDISKAATTLMHSKLEPRPSRTFPGMEAVLMSALEDSTYECPQAAKAMTRCKTIINRVLTDSPAMKAGNGIAHEVENDCNAIRADTRDLGDPFVDSEEAREWKDRFRDDLQNLLAHSAPTLHRIPFTSDVRNFPLERTWGEMWAIDRDISGHRFQVLVPPTAMVSRPGASRSSHPIGVQVTTAINVALLVDDIWWGYERRRAKASENCPAQLYFVSPDNVLGIWDKSNSDWSSIFPPYRNWSAAYYFQRWIRNGDAPNAPYVDYAGNGIVWTDSRPITRGVNDQEALIGVVAADIEVPTATLYEQLRNSSFVHGYEVCLTSQGSRLRCAGIEDLDLKKGTDECVGGEGLDPPHDGYEATLRDWLDQQLGDANISSNARTAVQSLSPPPSRKQGILTTILGGRSSQRAAFLVPLGSHQARRSGETHTAAILALPRPFFPERAANLALVAFGFGILAFFLVVSAQAKAAERRDSEDEMTLLRRLPVGIIVADSGDRLRGSNQSAETILGIPLPRRDDAASRNVAYATRNVFQDTIVLCDEDGKERKAASYGETIPGERRRGQESSYYAKLVQGRSKDRWVRVMAMPIPIGRDPRDGAPTFAAIMKVDETKEKDLNQMAESFKEIAS